jgi:hypothetical protein
LHFHIPSFRYFLYSLPLLALLCWWGLQDRPDPVWTNTLALMREPCPLVTDVPDSLQALYNSLHNRPAIPGDRSALELISKPSLSTIEWTAFSRLVRAVRNAKNRSVVITGVTGVGATKQAKKAALLLTGQPANILQIDCSPQFDILLHDTYIGTGQGRVFQPGQLVRFWQHCKQQPDQRFVVLFDNLDKVNPETLFGPELWEGFSSARDTAVLGNEKVWLPDNCWMISVTHLGPGAYTQLNAEHFKRMGEPYTLAPNDRELLAWMRLYARKTPKTAVDSVRIANLRDTAKMHHALFYFARMNALLCEKYSEGYALGQGSTLRDLLGHSDTRPLRQTYLSHINSLRPGRILRDGDFDDVEYSIRTQGLAAHSNFFARQIQFLEKTGYLVEITMVLATALLTFLGGWWLFYRREQIIRRYGERTQAIFAAFEHRQISAENASRQLEAIKREVDDLVMRRRLNYTEGLYFLAFIEDKAKRIDFARNVSENFLSLFNAFMEDEVLTENEYQKLRQFLQSMRHKIPEELYEEFNEKVERTYFEQ